MLRFTLKAGSHSTTRLRYFVLRQPTSIDFFSHGTSAEGGSTTEEMTSRRFRRHLDFRFKTERFIVNGETPSRCCASKHTYCIEHTAITTVAIPQKQWRAERRGASTVTELI